MRSAKESNEKRKGRGRPKKVVADDADVEKTEDKMVTEEKLPTQKGASEKKGGRGRPKKVVADDADVEMTEDSMDTDKKLPVQTKGAIKRRKQPEKGRGRPRKIDQDADDVAASDSSAVSGTVLSGSRSPEAAETLQSDSPESVSSPESNEMTKRSSRFTVPVPAAATVKSNTGGRPSQTNTGVSLNLFCAAV